MPRKNKAGPPKGSNGPRDGRGKGKGRYSEAGKGVGARKGGAKGSCTGKPYNK